uniref:Uncharacterized protein n=1 Tax=Coccolithus braarudii TaxID=221442 RepID=A0A7S0L762_9EUKA|mmetsp:Transcript_24210/g.52214  ORF Transcript_24210/g.52214 Transcript_24210/m.52214 type:complete len:256 (+) Transcript_24210:98-865(+)|eukprot:CAMPEP_0183354110 /NCGR_PEP_ID=MMETSP0164_2-20130417/36812_1 /TAXON_ID=221442 /ORGANISM="Coccolithus pelagicus ssp braarudi, Strain PLY182g" /LENGTH=255 /DNA_ID=CAMNT_0025526939 /DNA_START=88 /DNA_END=855 /DNA_ORIENTATION=+
MSHAQLEDVMGRQFDYKNNRAITSQGDVVHMQHQPRGLYCIQYEPAPPMNQTHMMQADVCYSTRQALLWSARLNIGPEALKLLPTTTVDHGLTTITPAMLKAIETDDVRKQAYNSHNLHAATMPTSLAAKPGGRFIIDAWGPYKTPSVAHGATMLIGGSDEASGIAVSQQVRTHTTERYVAFVMRFAAEFEANGWVLVCVRVDNAPGLASPKFEEAMNNRSPPIDKEGASTYDPERVGKQERVWGIVQPHHCNDA